MSVGDTCRNLITQYFGVVMSLGFAIGLFVPGIENSPKFFVPVILSIVIFFSCSQIRMADFKAFRVRDVISIIVLRFIFLPFAIFYCSKIYFPEYTSAALMLALLPCGASLPAILGVVGGNVALGLSAVTITSIMAPLVIPLFFFYLGDVAFDIDVIGMFKTLALMIFVPIILYFGWIRRYKKTASIMRENAPAVACIMISIMVGIAVSYQKSVFFGDFAFVLKSVVLGFILYALFYFGSWLFAYRQSRENRISYSLMSGQNNIGLGISLAVMFLPIQDSAIIVIWELNWILSLIIFQRIAKSKYI